MPRPRDRRDEPTWVLLELTPIGQQHAEAGTLEDDLLEYLGAPFHWPVFVPSRTFTRGGRRYTVHLVEGYAFIGSGYEEARYFALEHVGAKLVKQVMSTETLNGIRVLHTVKNSKVEDWKAMLRDECTSDIKEGANVTINEGKLKDLEAEVLDVDGEYADVLVKLRSAHGIARLPRYFLEVRDTPV